MLCDAGGELIYFNYVLLIWDWFLFLIVCMALGRVVISIRIDPVSNSKLLHLFVLLTPLLQRFLKALGYLSSPRPGLVEEQIQMHADTLYHRMLAQEAAIAAAKASNTPIPTFPPIMTSSSSPGNSSVALVSPSTSSERTPPLTTTTTDPTTPSSSTSSPAQQKQEQEQPPPPYLPARPFEQFSKDHLTPSAREALQKRLKDLPDEERELEERALAMEASQSDAVGRTLGKILSESERKRKERRETGEAGVGDWIAWLFGR